MKRIISVLLLLVICLSLCACGGSKYTFADFEGTWVREKYINPQGDEYSIIVHLHADGTYVREASSSTGEYKEIRGTWEFEKDRILLNEEKLVAGSDSNYDENGNALFSKSGMYLDIYDTSTLKNGDLFYTKEK